MTRRSMQAAPKDAWATMTEVPPHPEKQPPDRPQEIEPDSEIGEEDPGAAVDQPAVEPIYPPGSHGH